MKNNKTEKIFSSVLPISLYLKNASIFPSTHSHTRTATLYSISKNLPTLHKNVLSHEIAKQQKNPEFNL